MTVGHAPGLRVAECAEIYDGQLWRAHSLLFLSLNEIMVFHQEIFCAAEGT
jgi:hypothetical protein